MIYTDIGNDLVDTNDSLRERIEIIEWLLDEPRGYSYSQEELEELKSELKDTKYQMKQNKELILDEIV